MKKSNMIKIVVGILCIVLVVTVAVVAVVLDGRPLAPIIGIFQTDEDEPKETKPVTDPSQGETPSDESTPADSNEETAPTGSETLQEEIPTVEPEGGSTVEIPGEEDPETGITQLQFPCKIPEYDLVIEKLDAYGGLFVEDGSNGQVENVAMLMIHNQGDFPIEYTQISVQVGQEQLLFNITALPAGEKIVVQEKSGKPMPKGTASAAKALVVQGANMEMSEELVRVTDNGDNTLTIQNLTNKTIPTVRVFYKYFMEDENIFVGGIAFTLRITRLGPGASVTVQPSHYNSMTSQVVMVLTYDSEV